MVFGWKNQRSNKFYFSFSVDGYLGIAVGQVAFIARTNAIVFETAIEIFRSQPNRSLAFTSDAKTCKKELNTIMDVYRLFKNEETNKIKSKLIQKMLRDVANANPFEKLKDFARDHNDVLFKRKIKVRKNQFIWDMLHGLLMHNGPVKTAGLAG